MKFTLRPTAILLSFLFAMSVHSQTAQLTKTGSEFINSNRMIEIRSYNLKPGTRNEFHRLFLDQALPLLRKWKVEVVAFGPSLHDSDSYFLVRSYKDLEDMQRSENTFYGSDPPNALIIYQKNFLT